VEATRSCGGRRHRTACLSGVAGGEDSQASRAPSCAWCGGAWHHVLVLLSFSSCLLGLAVVHCCGRLAGFLNAVAEKRARVRIGQLQKKCSCGMKWEDVSLRSASDEEVSLSILRHFLQFLCASNFIRNQPPCACSTLLMAWWWGLPWEGTPLALRGRRPCSFFPLDEAKESKNETGAKSSKAFPLPGFSWPLVLSYWLAWDCVVVGGFSQQDPTANGHQRLKRVHWKNKKNLVRRALGGLVKRASAISLRLPPPPTSTEFFSTPNLPHRRRLRPVSGH
jgi:hypothetical protein